MKLLTLIAITFVFQTTLNAEVFKVNTPVKDKDIIALVNQSVSLFLKYSDSNKSGGLDKNVSNPTIIEITKKNKRVENIKVKSEAYFLTFNSDFDDPVDEVETTCLTTLYKNSNNVFSIDKSESVCDFNPSLSISQNPSGEPCCEGGAPVVDSNMCFDSYEEGLEACNSLVEDND